MTTPILLFPASQSKNKNTKDFKKGFKKEKEQSKLHLKYHEGKTHATGMSGLVVSLYLLSAVPEA